MKLQEFENQIDSNNAKIKDRVSDPASNREPIYDGAVNFERYFKSPIKIAWLLKEAYDEENGKGGGWDYSDLLDRDDVYEEFFSSHKSRSTWHPIIYISYSILDGFKSWGELDYLRDEPEMSLIVKDIAIINTQKLPAMNMTWSSFEDIQVAFNQHNDILMEQLEILNPDVIICGGTFCLYNNIWGFKEKDVNKLESVNYYFRNNKIYIDAYHPAQRSIKRERYVNDIVAAAKEWFKKYRSV